MKRKAIFLLYRAGLTLAFPAIPVYLLLRVLRNSKYLPTLRERFGELPALWQKTVPGAIWLHAVSVGEVLAAIPLIDELARRTPRSPLFLSVGTLAGHETATTRLQGKIDGIFFAPLDYVWIVRRILRRLQPSVLVVLETEIWPNLFHEARRVGCGVAIVNARISDKAINRYRRFSWFFGEVLPLCDRIAAQSDEMAARFIEAGAPPEIVSTTGNLKYDFEPPSVADDSPALRFIEASAAPLLIAASTSADDRIEEEDAVINAFRKLRGWRLIVAPRKPERFESIAR